MTQGEINWDRYRFEVEHERLADYCGGCKLHAYVCCIECWRTHAGLRDPRTMVIGPDLGNALSTVAELSEGAAKVMESIAAHEAQYHAPS